MARRARKPAKSREILSLRALATHLDRSHTAVANWLRHPAWEWARIPPWPAADVEAMRVWGAATLKPDRSDPTNVADPLMVMGGNSPQLERYRGARARLAELDVAEREGELVPLVDVLRIVDGMANLVSSATQKMRTRFGNEVGDMWNEMVDSYLDRQDRAVKELAKKSDADDVA